MKKERMSRTTLLTIALSLIMTLFTLVRAGAEIYGYQDRDGFWHFPGPDSRKNHTAANQSSRRNLEAFFQAYQLTIRQASETFGVESNLIKAVIKAESDFDHRALSRKGALGLMQLMPETAREMEVDNPFNPAENIMGGTRYLALLLRRFDNNKPMALAAFNAGPERVEACGRIPAIAETRKYVKRVLFYYDIMKKETE